MFHVARNVRLPGKHGRQYSRNIIILNIIWCIVFFCIDKDVFRICFSQEIRPPFSVWDAKRFEII
jgi:hypothetical protein